MTRWLAALATLTTALMGTAWAEGVLYVSPLRVEAGPGQQTATLSVTNKASTVKRYAVVATDQIMNSDGVTETVDNFEYSAKRMIRFMPRRIVLEPGQRQLVRVMIRRPNGLPDGDYHTHLLFEEEQPSVSTPAASTTLPDKGFALDIGTVYSVAIPVVVQHGTVSSSIALGDLTLNKTARPDAPRGHILAVVERGGNAEATGFLTITAPDGKTDLVAPRRVRVYHEVDTVRLVLPLTEAGAAYHGPAKVLFRRDNTADAVVIAERTLTLP